MTLKNPTEAELARADFIRASNREARNCLLARLAARQAVAMVKEARARRGANHDYKMAGHSMLVHYRDRQS